MPVAALLPADIFPESELLPALLDLSLTGLVAYTPLTDASGAVVDLAFAYLNPAALRLLGLSARPAASYLAQFPASLANGAFAFHRDALLTAAPQQRGFNYQVEGRDTHFQLAAQRVGGGLLVSFTDLASLPPSAAIEALRASQAREQQARAEAERQQATLHHVLMQAPAMICIFEGPSHRFQLVNGPYQALVGERPLLGLPIAEAMPELAGQPIFELLDTVYRTGEPFLATEMLVQLDHDNSHPAALAERYYNFTYQARRNLQGHVDGILVFAYEVTAQVQARRVVEDTARRLSGLNQQLDTSNEELATANEELQVSNEEYLINNTELARAQLALRQLNDELEARVAARSHEVQAALREAEAQREQLRTQQRLLRQILGQVPAAIATLTGPEHRYSFFNEGYLTLTGGRAQLGHPVAEALPELVQQGFLKILDRVQATGQAYAGTETPLQLRDVATGQFVQRYIDFVYQPITDEQGQVENILAFLVDATDKVHARREADQQRALLHTLFMDAPAPIAILEGPSHVYQLVNPAYQQIFPSRALAGRPVFEALPELADTAVPGLLQHVYTTGEPFVAQELPLQLARHDGAELQQLYFNFTYQPRYTTTDQIDGILVFAYEVTEQVRARQAIEESRQQTQALADELATTNQRLRRTNADLDTFVYTASHDLKSPIANLEGLFTALREQLPPEALQAPLVPRLLEMMDGAVQRFRETLTHLTDVSRLQPDDDGTPAEEVDLVALVRAIRLDLAADLEAVGATLTVDLADAPTARFSPKNLRSILYNLLSNAVKYHDPARPPLVQLRGRRAENRLLLEVQDNGLGLDPSQQSQLFGMFQRLHTHVEGSGVGLYMVKRLVENTGGHIHVASQPGVGSLFSVSLPA
ncbi:MAG: PAS domain-containing protein [Janthinobacterium lividum]